MPDSFSNVDEPPTTRSEEANKRLKETLSSGGRFKLSGKDRSLFQRYQTDFYWFHSNREKRILGLGFNHIALNVENVDDVFKKLVSLGLQYVNEPKVNNEGTAKVSFCRDYEDNLLELVQLMRPSKNNEVDGIIN